MNTLTSTTQPSMSRQQRLCILAICSVSLLIVGLDVTIVNVALPTLQNAFHASVAGLQWMIDAYTLVLASLLMLAGSIADRMGRKRVFIAGLVLFSLGSLLCAFAPNLRLLIIFRVVQAIGGSMLSPATMAIVRNTFEDARERAKAIGIFTSMFGISMALGPVLGGFLVGSFSWPAIFLINVPIGIIAIALAWRFVRESQALQARRFDPIGQMLIITTLAALTYAIIEGSHGGFAAPSIIIAVACSVLVVPYELKRDEPLLEMRFFKSPPFAGASMIALCLSAALGGFLFMSTLYLQGVRALSPLHAGLFMLPTAVTLIIFAPLSGRMIAHFGARPSMVFGGLMVSLSGSMLTKLTSHTSVLFILGAYAVFGLGFALVSPSIAHTAVSSMPPEQAGVASAVATTTRQTGIALGVAIFGAAAGNLSKITDDFANATRLNWWIMTALGLIVALLGYITTTPWAHTKAQRVALRLRQ